MLDRPRHLTLTFVEPRPIEEVLRLVVADTPFSLAIDADVTGVFRGELRDLTLRDALATLLTPLGLEFSLDGTVLRITRRRSETRQFDLNVLDMRRELQRTTGTAPANPMAARLNSRSASISWLSSRARPSLFSVRKTCSMRQRNR